MTDIFSVIVLTALVVNGVEIATGDRMILSPLKTYLHKKIGKKAIYKPLIGCVKCMPSIYGTCICLLFLPFTWHLVFIIPVVILASCTLATYINTLYP